MKKIIVRIESIEINNFKNVEYGILNFKNHRKSYVSSILGLYGQNGSGKTALIDTLSLLKLALSGKSVPVHFSDFIHIDVNFATLKFNFKILDKETMENIMLFMSSAFAKTLMNLLKTLKTVIL